MCEIGVVGYHCSQIEFSITVYSNIYIYNLHNLSCVPPVKTQVVMMDAVWSVLCKGYWLVNIVVCLRNII